MQGRAPLDAAAAYHRHENAMPTYTRKLRSSCLWPAAHRCMTSELCTVRCSPSSGRPLAAVLAARPEGENAMVRPTALRLRMRKPRTPTFLSKKKHPSNTHCWLAAERTTCTSIRRYPITHVLSQKPTSSSRKRGNFQQHPQLWIRWRSYERHADFLSHQEIFAEIAESAKLC